MFPRILSRSADYTGKLCTINAYPHANSDRCKLLPDAYADKRDRWFGNEPSEHRESDGLLR